VDAATAGGALTPTEVAAHERDLSLERASIRGAYWTGSRLFVALSAMLFGAAVFTYFYLHSLDNDALWRAPGQRPSDFISVPVLVMVLAGAALFWFYTWSWQSDRARTNSTDWRVACGISTALFLAAGITQLVSMTSTGFEPGSSGYASVYVATMPLFAIYCLVTAYWLETLLARSLRVRWVLSPEGPNRDDRLQIAFAGSALGAKAFVVFVALVAVVVFILFSVLN
jgi:heme/copper-type cytochrome/quinol oxidase subunit 3